MVPTPKKNMSQQNHGRFFSEKNPRTQKVAPDFRWYFSSFIPGGEWFHLTLGFHHFNGKVWECQQVAPGCQTGCQFCGIPGFPQKWMKSWVLTRTGFWWGNSHGFQLWWTHDIHSPDWRDLLLFILLLLLFFWMPSESMPISWNSASPHFITFNLNCLEPSPRNSSDFSCFYSGWPCHFIHFIHFDPNFIPFFGVQKSRGKAFSSFTRGGRPIIFLVGNPRGLRKRRANFEARKGGATTESPVTMEAIELCFGEEIEEVARTLWWFGFGVGEDGGV